MDTGTDYTASVLELSIPAVRSRLCHHSFHIDRRKAGNRLTRHPPVIAGFAYAS
jgi:hypothetical protein